jgi:hypothetical protein
MDCLIEKTSASASARIWCSLAGRVEMEIGKHIVTTDIAVNSLRGVHQRAMTMSFDAVISDLRLMYRTELDGVASEAPGLKDTDIEKWSAGMNVPSADLYDSIAMYLAQGFHRNELPFSLCDAIVSDIYGIITASNEKRPELFWSIFLAFDEGEYYHRSNWDEDPVEAYTRPLIGQIIEGRKAPK